MMWHRLSAWSTPAIGLGVCLALVLEAAGTAKADGVTVTNLVTDDQSVNAAKITDPSLVNAWGISASSSSPFWVSDNGSGVSTLYSVNNQTDAPTKLGLTVTIPGDGSVTGQVFNTASSTGAFNKDNFLFVNEDGTISGWRGALGTTAETLVAGSSANVYKGVTLDTTGGNAYLLAANFRAGTIDVLKGSPGAPDLPGNFQDPNIPSGFAPFNIEKIGNQIFVTYAKQDPAKHDDVAGPGNGFVSAFDSNGNFIARVGTQGALNSPWGMAVAPSSFGGIAGDLLVGNFGDGHINIFNQTTDTFLGQLMGTNGRPIAIDGLWGLIAGNDGSAGNSNEIYFTAGPGDESHGLFGALSVPEPSSAILGLIATVLVSAGWQFKKRQRQVTI